MPNDSPEQDIRRSLARAFDPARAVYMLPRKIELSIRKKTGWELTLLKVRVDRK